MKGTLFSMVQCARSPEYWRRLQSREEEQYVIDGHIYGCHGDLAAIQLRCLDLNRGEMKWTQRQRQGRCMLLAAEGRLLSLSEEGSIQLIEARPDDYVLKGELPDLLNFRAWSTPALAHGRLYLRDQKEILCLDLRRGGGAPTMRASDTFGTHTAPVRT